MSKKNKKNSETIYRSSDGQRWRLSTTPKYDNELMAVRVKDGYILWDTSHLNELVEETIWLKNKKKSKIK